MAKLSKWFGTGSGHIRGYPGSDIMLVDWNGRDDDCVRKIQSYCGTKPYCLRYGVVYKSLAATLRAIENEHVG